MLVGLDPLAIVEEVRAAAELVTLPVLAQIRRRVQRYAAEREVDEVDAVRHGTDDEVAVTSASGRSSGIRREWGVRWDPEGLAEVVRLVEGAVVRLDDPLRRRGVDEVARSASRARTPELTRRERIAIDDDGRLAPETLVVHERGRREDVRRVGCRFRVPAATATGRLVEQYCCVGHEVGDVAERPRYDEKKTACEYRGENAGPATKLFHVSLLRRSAICPRHRC